MPKRPPESPVLLLPPKLLLDRCCEALLLLPLCIRERPVC